MKLLSFLANALLFSSLILSGCASSEKRPRTVVLKHPETQDFVNCNVDKWGTEESYQKNEECIKGYKEKGYEIWGTRR